MISNVIFSVVQSLSVTIASSVAIYGITAWRREAKWKRKYELAEEVLSLFYECKEKFAVIRDPFSNSSEGKTRKRGDKESLEESKILDDAYVFFERYDREKEPFIKLRTLKFRFMTIFGKETGEYFDEITKILNTILFSARSLGQRHWKEQGRKAFSDLELQSHLKEMNNHEKNVWATFGENDEIVNRIDNCIIKIEGYCKSVITK